MGSLRPSSVFFFKLELFSSKVVSERFFRRILKASCLTNPFLEGDTRLNVCARRFPFV